MLKQHIVKLVAGLAVVFTLFSGVVFGAGTPVMAKVVSGVHPMGCLIIYPPCI